MAKTQTTEANAAAFTKAQLVASQRYVHRRDLIGALLEDGNCLLYTSPSPRDCS